MSSTGAIVSWGATVPDRLYTEIECIAGPGDSVKVYDLTTQVTYQ